MWQLLYYAAVSLVAASSAGLLATYIAVTRFAVVGRCITFALHRGLRGVSETQPEQEHAPAFKVTRTARGVRVEDLRLAQDLLERSSQLGCMLSRVAVRLVEVQFATLSEPMRVHMDGLDIELLQRRLPEYMGPEELAQRQQAQDGAIKAAKLAAIDKLLWSTNFAQPHASPTAEHMGGGSRTARFAVHRLLAICIQFLEVQASNVSVTCTQAGQPGPQPTPGSALDGKDSVVLALRKLVLEPQSEVSELDYDQAAEGAQPTQGTAAQILAWMGCLKLPSAIWRQLTLNRPRSMRLQVAGVSVALVSHGKRSQPAAAQAPTTAAVPGAGANRVTVESLRRAGKEPCVGRPASSDEDASEASISSTTGLDRPPVPTPQPVVRRRSRRQLEAAGPQAPQPSAEHAHRHELLRQWGVEVFVTVLPPGWHSRPGMDSAHAAPTSGSTLSSTTERNGHRSSAVRPANVRFDAAHPQSEHGHLNGSILHHDALQRPAGLPMHRTNSEDSFAESVESAQQCKHQHRHRHPADEDEAVNASGSSCCMLDVEVQLRALVPTWDAASVVTAIRMLDRLQTYQQYAPYWQSRPQIAVSVNPGAWWCHAGLATAQVCRQISRQQVCLHSMDKRRRARLRYQRAYAARCASLPTWQDDRAWWQLRKRMAPADAHDHATLEQLEASLSVEQIAHFRAGVAALHSKPLLRNEAVFRHAMDALDAMIAATGPLPPAIEALIFQQDMCSSQNRLFGLVMSVSCPKVGIILDVGEVWTATTPRMPSSQFASLEAAVRGVTCKMTAESKVVVNIASIGGGGMCLRDGQMTAEVLSSPSAECNRLLRVADLQAVATREDTFYSSKHAGLDFLYMRISLHSGYQQDKPLRGRHVATAESAVQATEEWHALQPAGMDVSLRLAGIKVAYKTDVVAAALAFVGQLHRLQGLRLKPAPQSAPPVPPPPPPDPSQPANLAERVLHAFAQQDIAIHSPLALPHLTLKLTCPGVVLQIPYKHVNWEAKPCGRPDPQSSHAGAPAPPDEPEYELIAAVTVISARVFGEDFQHFMHSGATQRFSIGASLDLFCYQQPHNRVRAGAGPTTMARLASLKRARSPGGEKPLELPALRQATAQEAAANSIDDDAEMMAMARVWAHPEDLPLFPGGDNEVGRSYSDAFEHASLRPDLPKVAVQPGSMTSGGLLGSLPPFPLIPLAKVALSQTEVSRKVHSLPAAPGSTILNAALGVVGIHFWVSPWQVAHVLSILRAVKDVAPNTLLTSPPEQPAAPVPSGQGTSALKTQLRFSLSMEIPLITALCLVAQPHAAAPDSLRLRKGKAAWGNHRLAHEELAAGWSRSLAHVYGINLVGLRAAANYKGTGEIKAGLNLDGFLTRDLQLSANAPNAYFARPLPQRSLVLTEYACDFRRRLLRVATPHKAVKRWLKAVRLIYLRRRSSQSWVYGVAHRLDASATAAVPFASPFSSSVTGPQLSLNFLMRAPNKYPGHPHHRPAPPADLKVEVGQMLLYARVSMRNRMLPLTTQMMSLVTAYLRTSAASSPAGEPTPVSPPPAACQTSDLPVPQAHFPGLKVHAGCVGVDLVMLVDGRELVSLKLLDAVVLTDTQPVQTGSQDAALSVGVTIQDICIRDLQAQPGHQLVLRPNGDSRYCSLALEFIKPASLHGKPSLIVEMDNPRVLALFRFVYDILHAVTIIQGALAPAAVGAGRLRTSGGLEERSSPSQTSANVSMPLDVTVHLTNASAVLPASSRSRQVLACDIAYAMLALPGEALPDSALAAASMPSISGMQQASLDCCRLYSQPAGSADPSATSQPPPPPRPPAFSPDLTQRNESDAQGQAAFEGSQQQPQPEQLDITKSRTSTAKETAKKVYKKAQHAPQGVLFPSISLESEEESYGDQGVLHVDVPAASPSRATPPSVATGRTPFAAVHAQLPAHQPVMPSVPEDAAVLGDLPAEGGPSGPRAQDAAAALSADSLDRPVEPARRTGSAPARLRFSADVLQGTSAQSPIHAQHAGSRQRSPQDASSHAEAFLAVLLQDVSFYRAKLAPLAHCSPGNFCPISVHSYAWPLARFDVVERGCFVHHSSYALIMHHSEEAAEEPYMHLHLTTSPISTVLNVANYAALLSFTSGNLVEVSSFTAARPAASPHPPTRSKFDPSFKFGVPAGDVPTFRMTLNIPQATSVFEADAALWQSDAFKHSLATSHTSLPFLKCVLTTVQMDLAVLRHSKSTHISITSSAVAADDLRLAYSHMLSEIENVPEHPAQALPRAAPLTQAQPAKPAKTGNPFAPQSAALPSPFSQLAGQPLERTRSAPSPPARRLSVRLRQASPSPTASVRPPHLPLPASAPRAATGQLRRQHSQSASQGTAAPRRPSMPGDTSGHTSPDLLFPVMEVVAVEEVPGGLEGIPVLHLLTGPHTPPGDEVAHLQSSSQHLNNQPTVEVTLALMPDGTVAVEASLAHALLQWPFLTDLSLILAMTSIFALGAEADADAGEASRNATEQFMRTNGQAPWLYFNFVMTKSQIFVPVLEMASMHDAVQYYFGGGAEKMNMNERLGDILLMAMSLSLDDPGACLHLEERGLALTWSALRFAYSMGGDGETDIRVDLRKLAAFVRDPAACVTCLLLPFSGSAHVSMQAPQAAERAEAERVRRAVVRVQRWWRLHKWQRCAERGRPFRRTDSRTSERGLEGKADLAVEFARRLGQNVSMLRMPSPQQDSMLDDLVEEVATPRTRQLLHKYKQSGAKAQLTTRPMVGPATERAAIKIEMSIKLGACTLRAAFSHIPFLQSAMSLLQRVALHPAPGNIAAPPLPQALPAAPATQLQMNSAFRPTKLSISGTLQSLALVLCNDQPQTFGAPDVLELCTDLVCVQYAMDRHFADRPPDQAFQLQLRSWASFLNNSSSRWEAISEAWSLQAELVDRASPIYRSDHTRSIWLSSEQHLNLYFNPASLLSFGDVLAFWRALTAASPGQTALQPTVSSTSAHSPSFLLTAAQNAPAMEEQLASQASITSRVPQKYLIQNQSGLLVYYWAEEPEVGVARPHSLASGASETLQVVPVQKTLHMMAVGKGGGTEKLGNVINLHFEGNWMPIKDVAVSVVGKYRYHMQSPAEQNNVSVIVDIILVGRTKIITLHSGIWLENHMDRPCSFRLHVPITPLVAPARPGTASREVSNTDTIIGPLASGTGSYLPVSAVLGGLLYAQPEGYCEAVRDVVRLSASIRLLKEQQGYISCEPLGPQEGGPPTPLPLHCCMLVIPAQVNSEFQAYKHIEILAPGELMRAVTPLEATLALHPTLVLTNALPYSMKCIIWQASPFRKLRKVRKEGRHTGLRDFVKYDLRQMHTAFTGTVPITGMANPYYKGEDHELASASGSQHEEVPWRRNSHSLMPASLLPHTSQRLWTPGQHLVVSLEPGQTKDVYAHMAGNLLMHVEVPALGLTASHWSVISWAGGQIARNSISDAKYIYRLPKDLKLRGPPSHSFASHQASLGTTRLRAAAREFRDTLLCTRHLAADTRRMAAQLPSQLSETELVQPDTPLLDRPGDHSSSPTWQTHDNPLAADASSTSAGEARQAKATAEQPPRSRLALVSNPTYADQAVEEIQPAASPRGPPNSSCSPRAPPDSASRNAARAGQAAGNAMLMRLVFDAWREASVKRHISTISQVFLPSRRAAANAPPTMHLGIDNSMAGNSSDRSVCKVTLFAPYWIDNRTGIDLIFQDHPSAPSIALLCGANTPWDYAEVLVPGVGLLQRGSSAGLRDLGTAEDPKVDEIPVRPVLLNKQDVTRFALGDVSRKFFSQALSIHTVGLKGTVKIKGPEAVHLALVPDFVRAHLRSSMPSGLRRVEEEARPQPTPVPEAPPAPADGEEEERLVVVLLSPQDDEERVKLHIVMAPELAGERMARSSLTMAEVLSTLSESEGSSSDSERPEQPAASVDDSASGPPRAPPQPSSRRRGQREYQFAVDVSAGPPTSVFRHTKVVTIKSKYIVENLTGMSVEIKQRGMPNNSPDSFAVEGRCSRQLANKDRCAVHWDDVQLPRQLLVRPLGNGGMDMWHWSGGFTLHTKDEYFGVRVRHQLDPARAINIPVSTTVGPSGSVLVTFKSPLSVPPYRIENHCEDVIVFFAQDAVHRDRTKWNWLEPRLGGAAMAYAWDEPNMEHRLRVQACVTGKVGPLQQRSQTYSLDQLGVQASLFLPTVQSRTETGGTLGALESNPAVTEEMKEKLASLLAAEFSRKVYVSVYADGPTRVLRLANSPSVALQETEESILDLAARIKQVEAEVEEVNVRFARLHGLAGGRDLDLYGRAANAGSAATPAPAKPRMRSRLSRGDQLPSHKPLLKLKELAGTPPAGSPLSASGAGASTSFASGAPPQAGPNQPLQRENTFTSGKADTSPLETLARASVEAFTQGESSLSQAGPYATDTDGNPVRMARITDAGHLTALPPASQTVQGTSLIRSAVEADTALLLGGDLIVSVCQADGLRGGNRTTHPFARVEINRQAQQTSVQWQTTAPVWDESLTFRDVSAASELVVDLWDLGGTRGEEALQKLASNPSQVIANSRFLGRVEVPLSETLSLRRGSKRWYTLARRSAHDSVAGRLKLGFAWDVTARSLLTLKLAMLERVLAQRVEILCMLQPVPAQVAADWLLEEATPPRADKAQGATNSQQLPPGQDAAQLSELLLAKHARQEHHANLLVSVLEATGLQPRKGLVVALAASDLPNPVVHFAIAGQQVHEVSASHTLKPRFPAAKPMVYSKVPTDTTLTVLLHDRNGRLGLRLLGRATISCSQIEGDRPVYVWLPLTPPSKSGFHRWRNSRVAVLEPASAAPELQVLLRLQWVRQAERGQHTRVEVDLEGLGVSVMGGLQDELFNLTLDRVSLHGHLTKLEAKMAGSIRRVQLDNQMLDATQPVVLASAPVAHARSETAQALVGGDGNLVSFKVIRSFANSMAALGLEGPGASTPAGNHRARPARMPHSHLVADGKQSPDGQGTIMSFKLIQLYIGETDFQADDGFLEALLSFVVSIPTPDIWQDAAWREQQHRLLTAQFGPKEVESLAMNSVLPLPGLAQDSAAPLRWVQEKELQELTAMRGQSSYSSWYFIEHAQISDINVNVTIALSSSILATRHGSAGLPENRGGLFNRVIGTAGFSLINVNNVPLQLRGWSTTGRLTARRALLASLTRHYLAQAIGEAHKVLGGAGPAIAALPLTVVWAGGSFLSLATNISAGKVGPYGAAKRIGFVLFMSLAQSIGSFSRIGASVMAYLPPPRAGHFSDSGMLTRAVQRPPNAFDAFQRAASELGAGFIAGLAGVLLDPLQGWNSSGLTGAAVGMGKGLLGLPVRPAIGVFEGCSKTAHGLGLVCLGREAISGSVQRRMRAPGAFAEDQQEGSQDSSKQQMQANRQSVIAAWQQALPGAFPKMQDDVVMDVLSTRIGRVLILTDQHLALLRVKVHGSRSIYKAMWTVPMAEIRTVRGLEERLLMIVEHVHSYKIPLMGMWAVPSRKSVRCDSRATFEKIIMKVNRHIRQGTMHSQAGGFNNSFAGDSYADLSMVTRPAS